MYYALGISRAVDSYHSPTAYFKKEKNMVANLFMVAFLYWSLQWKQSK